MQKSQQADFQTFDAGEWRIGFVVAQFNREITQQLEQSARLRANDYNIPRENIDTVPVAGSIEIPLVLQQLAGTNRYQALLAIGCIIKGETPHFDYVCKFVTEGVLRVQLDHSMPIGFGILTCSNEAQARARVELGSQYLDAVLQQAKALKDYS